VASIVMDNGALSIMLNIRSVKNENRYITPRKINAILPASFHIFLCGSSWMMLAAYSLWSSPVTLTIFLPSLCACTVCIRSSFSFSLSLLFSFISGFADMMCVLLKYRIDWTENSIPFFCHEVQCLFSFLGDEVVFSFRPEIRCALLAVNIIVFLKSHQYRINCPFAYV